MVNPLLYFHRYILFKSQFHGSFLCFVCAIPSSQKKSYNTRNDHVTWHDQCWWSKYPKKLDLQVRFCFLFHIFFKSLKVINFKKHFNNEEELKRTQVMFFYELCYMSVIEILPSITEHFLFMLTYKIEKMINQAENP